jgi:hypothetical protein
LGKIKEISSYENSKDAVTQRFIYCFDWLQSKHNFGSTREFCLHLGILPQNIANIKKGERGVSQSIVTKMVTTYPEVAQYIMTGVGKPGQDTVAEEPMGFYGKVRGIPFYAEVWASAGSEFIFDTREVISGYITIPGLNDCDAAISVIGDSMRPRFEPGDIILLKRMQGSLYIWGAAYLIVTRDHRLLKYVQPASSQEQIRLVSANEYYQEMLISCDEILHAFLVKGRVQKLAL